LRELGQKRLNFPVIFIISSDEGCQSRALLLRRVFPDDIIEQVGIRKLNFNAATSRSVTAALK